MKLLKGQKMMKKYELPSEGEYEYTIIDISIESYNELTDKLSIKYSLNDGAYIHTQRYYLSDDEVKYQYTTQKFYQWLDIMERTYGKENLYTDDGNFDETYLIGTTGILSIVHNGYGEKTYANVDHIEPNGIQVDVYEDMNEMDIDDFIDKV